jgi:hypothetical protein
MTTRKKVFAIVEANGLELTDQGDCLILDAPDGMSFGGVAHSYCYDISDGITGPWSDKPVWADIFEDLKQPLLPCEIVNCETCVA